MNQRRRSEPQQVPQPASAGREEDDGRGDEVVPVYVEEFAAQDPPSDLESIGDVVIHPLVIGVFTAEDDEGRRKGEDEQCECVGSRGPRSPVAECGAGWICGTRFSSIRRYQGGLT